MLFLWVLPNIIYAWEELVGFFPNITGIPGRKTITNDGSLYATSDFLTVTGGGQGASISIEDIGAGGVSEV